MSLHLLSLGATVTAAGPDASGHRPVNWVALIVVVVLFVVVAVIGFLAARWRTDPSARGLHSLDEWGLGGRGFGTWVTWFLLGGDLYTAYTFVAVPAPAKSLSQPPINVLRTSTSQFSTPACSLTYRLARVDLPMPGGPLRVQQQSHASKVPAPRG